VGPHGSLRAHRAPSSAITNPQFLPTALFVNASEQLFRLSCSLPFASPVAVNNCSTICYAFLSRTMHCDRERKRNKGKKQQIGESAIERPTTNS
jgi:hypothetical protein